MKKPLATIKDVYCNVNETAVELGLSKPRIRALIKRPFDRRSRVLRAEKIGHSGWMIKKTEIARFRKLKAKAGRPEGSRKRKQRRDFETLPA